MRWRGIATAAVAVATCAAIAGPVDAARAARAGAWAAAPRCRTQVVGTVVDREGRGVPGARVVARPTRARTLAGDTLTDAAGRFRFVGLPPGEYWFVAIHGGYPIGATPAMPVEDQLEVSIALWGQATTI